MRPLLVSVADTPLLVGRMGLPKDEKLLVALYVAREFALLIDLGPNVENSDAAVAADCCGSFWAAFRISSQTDTASMVGAIYPPSSNSRRAVSTNRELPIFADNSETLTLPSTRTSTMRRLRWTTRVL